MKVRNNMNENKNNIQWFPGHMAKTRRQIKKSLPMVDAVCITLDARIPESSSNPELSDILANKPKIMLLCKSDIADMNITREWIEYYKKKGIAALAVDCRTGKNVNFFLPAVRELLKEKIESNIEKGIAGKPLRIMVVGIPNTGKSSFINRMAGKNKAKVEDRPGVTRENAWFPIGDGFELLDTPGMLWPKFEDPEVGDKLAFIGSVKDEIIDTEALCVRLLKVMSEDYAENLKKRYGLEDFSDKQPYEILEMIGRKRGMLVKGGEVDTLRAANTVLDEYRAGMLGRISLERPPNSY